MNAIIATLTTKARPSQGGAVTDGTAEFTMNVLHVTEAGARPSGALDPVERLAEMAPNFTVQRVDVRERDLRTAVRRQSADVTAAGSLGLPNLLATINGSRDGGRPCVVYGGLPPGHRPADDHPRLYDSLCQCLYIAGTPYDADYVTTRGVPAERTFVIGHGLDHQRFLASIGDARVRFGLHEGPVVGVIGGADTQTLVMAMERVWRRIPDAQLLVTAARAPTPASVDGILSGFTPEQRPLVVVRRECSDEERPALYAAMDVLTDLSGPAGFDITVVEAWAAAKPVIGWRRGALTSMIDEGVDGLLVEYREASGLAVAIVELLQNKERAEQMGHAGRSKVLVRHTWSRVTEQFGQVLRIALESAS